MSAASVKPLLVREKELPSIVGFKKTALRQLMAAGRFPQAIKIGSRGVAWKMSDLEAWVASGCGAVEEQRGRRNS